MMAVKQEIVWHEYGVSSVEPPTGSLLFYIFEVEDLCFGEFDTELKTFWADNAGVFYGDDPVMSEICPKEFRIAWAEVLIDAATIAPEFMRQESETLAELDAFIDEGLHDGVNK